MQSEFNQGAKYCRDVFLARIIGFQNGLGCNEESEQYQILQSLLETIQEDMGEMGKDFKG